MDASIDLKDTRVPTFIPFQQEVDKSLTKPALKRKRTAKSDNTTKPQKKKALKPVKKVKQDFKEENIEEPVVHHIWIGAATNEEKGAFAIYHGEKDKRNYTHVYEKKESLEDLEYAYVLGALKAVRLSKNGTTPIVVNTTCRYLPRAIAGKANGFQYESMAHEMRDIINDKELLLSVRHISGRHTDKNQTAALALAVKALDASSSDIDKQEINRLVVGELTQVVEKEFDATEEITKEAKDAIVVSSTSNDAELNRIVEDAIDSAAKTNTETIREAVESVINLATSDNKEVAAETQVETTVKTTVEVKVIETQVDPSAAEPMDLVEEVPQAQKSSWATVLGLQSIINVLTSPFKAHKN